MKKKKWFNATDAHRRRKNELPNYALNWPVIFFRNHKIVRITVIFDANVHIAEAFLN